MNRNFAWAAVVTILLAIGAGAFFLYEAYINPGDSDIVAADGDTTDRDDTEQDPANGQEEAAGEIPPGEHTAEGHRFVIPFERGDGSVTFSRQNGLLRVDLDVRLPYAAGDGRRWMGSTANLILSVDGKHGRQLVYLPAIHWLPDRQGSLPAFRMEMAYSKDGQPSRVADDPSFAGTSNVGHWARWEATLWIDRRFLVVPGNTPTSPADHWYVGVVVGNAVATTVFPEGIDTQNPANTPGRMLKIRFSELAERDELDENPREKLSQHESNMFDEMKSISASWNVGKFDDAFTKTRKAADRFPQALWPKFLSYLISQAAAKNPRLSGQGIDDDYLKYQESYVDASPGQSNAQIEFLGELLAWDKLDEAMKRVELIFNSELCTQREETAGFMRLEWAKQLVQWGYVDQARPLLTELKDNEAWFGNEELRVQIKLQQAALAEREGDSEKAAGIYRELIATEQDALDEQTFNQIQQLLQFQRQALESWEKEIELREADTLKKNPRLVIETDKGRFVIELFEDDSPNTVASLVKLAKNDFYDGLNFHRVEPGFVIQGGCPNGDGSGDPGYKLKFEENERTHFRGSVAMARSQDKDSAGSQFYVCLSNGPNVINLNKGYQVVGRVIEGMEVVDRIRVGDGIKTVTPRNLRDHEYEPEVIK